MVQWFKNLFQKKSHTVALLEFNEARIFDELEKLAMSIYRHRNEDSSKLLRQAMEYRKSLHVLSVNKTTKLDAATIARAQGRLEALNDLCNFFDEALDPAVHEALKQKRQGGEEQKKRVRMRQESMAEAAL